MFHELSVADILSFYRLNSRSQALLASWPAFLLVNSFGQNALRPLIATQAANRWTFLPLEDVIFTSECEICQEHGEILYLPKLLRCCFHCLSTDRRLLAVSVNYAATTLQFPKSTLQKLPIYTTAPQDYHWSFALGRMAMIDYKEAIEFSNSQEAARSTTLDTYPQQLLGPNVFEKTTFNLSSERRSVQPRPQRSLQARRQQQNGLAFLKIPSVVTKPREGPAGQHAYSVFLPAARRTLIRANGSSPSYPQV